MIFDEDEAQEYATNLLEGYDANTAAAMARSANNKTNSKRISGPRTADRQGHGLAPLISDLQGEQWYTAKSLTQDSRTDQEREQDYDRDDRVQTLLGWCTPKQKDALVVLYGIGTNDPLSYADAARVLGCSQHALLSRRADGLANMRQGALMPDDVVPSWSGLRYRKVLNNV